jgi:hypothetical protein
MLRPSFFGKLRYVQLCRSAFATHPSGAMLSTLRGHSSPPAFLLFCRPVKQCMESLLLPGLGIQCRRESTFHRPCLDGIQSAFSWTKRITVTFPARRPSDKIQGFSSLYRYLPRHRTGWSWFERLAVFLACELISRSPCLSSEPSPLGHGVGSARPSFGTAQPRQPSRRSRCCRCVSESLWVIVRAHRKNDLP